MTSARVESARQDWAEGRRRFDEEAGHDPRRADALHGQLEVVSAELRRRVGEVFTLAELADAYVDAEGWGRAAVADRAPAPAGALAVVVDAAFQLASRNAVDYVP